MRDVEDYIVMLGTILTILNQITPYLPEKFQVYPIIIAIFIKAVIDAYRELKSRQTPL